MGLEMGVEYSIVNRETHRLLYLGKGGWGRGGENEPGKTEWLRSREEIAKFVKQEYDRRRTFARAASSARVALSSEVVPLESQQYPRDVFQEIWLTDRIWEFVKDSKKRDVYVVDDGTWGDDRDDLARRKVKRHRYYEINPYCADCKAYCDKKYGPGLDTVAAIHDS
jgi:hypothetical protein